MSKFRKLNRSLALVIMLALVLTLLPMGAMATDPLTTTDAVDGLTISVDYATEKVYLQKNSSTSYTVLCDATDTTYYPYSFSLIMSSRSLVKAGTTSNPNPTVSNGGEFSWAYVDDGNGNWTESSTTPNGLVILPAGSGSTVTVVTTGNTPITFTCAQPNGGSSTTENGVHAFLPAPGQFTNEGMTTGGWGSAKTSSNTLKGLKGTTVTTGVSLGYFGGYAVFDFGTVTEGTGDSAVTKGALQNDPSHPYGVDFIVYGNAFSGNAEPGGVQVSFDGQVWYDLAGSMHYDSTTQWNYKVTYVNPTPGDNPNGTTGTRVNVPYYKNNNTSNTGIVHYNTFHNHSWFPLEANYFGSGTLDHARGSTRFPFAEYLTGQSVTVGGVTYSETLTLTGVLLGGVTSNSSASGTFGYFDCHPNGSNIGTATNPYDTGNTSSSGDGMDLAWAVYSSGTNKGLPVSSAILEKGFRYVRCYNVAAAEQNPFGEIGPELNGIVAITGTTGNVGTTSAPTSVTFTKDNYSTSFSLSTIPSNCGTVSDINNIRSYAGVSTTVSVKVQATSGSYVYVNGVRLSEGTNGTYTGTINTPSFGAKVRILVQNGTKAPYLFVIT